MKRFQYIVLLPLVTMVALGQPVHQSPSSVLPNKPEVVVASLYRDVIVYHPIGIPSATNMRVFTPYLSKTLLHRIALGRIDI